MTNNSPENRLTQETSPPPLLREQSRILKPGGNCWRIATASHAALLTNEDYFHRLAQALKAARRKVVLIGWHLDMDLVLAPGGNGPETLPLKDFLAELLGARPGLQIRLLLWDRTIFYGGNRLAAGALAELAATHAGLRHVFLAAPFASSHHAKLVVIDDRLAFIGGIDLAGDRWDRTHHPLFDPQRVTPAGDVYGPIHDLQSVIAGPAAAALAEYADARWYAATGERVAKTEPIRPPPWPDDLQADVIDAPMGIARTEPDAAGGPVREIEALNRDALASARTCVYLEAQYLTAGTIGDILVERLSEADGPEIVIVMTRTSHGYLEQFAMGNNRDRLLRRLRSADGRGRLRVYYPTTCDGADREEVKIHSKLIVIDDRLVRIGSSNLNNRSLAVDTECDVAFEAVGDIQRARIRNLRDRLVAGQLHRPVETVAAAVAAAGSLIGAIDRLNDRGYLQPLEVPTEEGPQAPLPGTALLDPRQPPTLSNLLSEFGFDGTNPLSEFDSGQ